MNAPQNTRIYTEQEYWALEEISPWKNEFVGGRIYRKPDEGLVHTTVCMNILAATHARLRGKPHEFFISDMKIKVAATGDSFYTNGSICGPDARFTGEGDHTLLTPTVIFEVLSPATQIYDRRDKFLAYRQIESLNHYVLADSECVAVDHYRRTSDGWLLNTYTSRSDVVRLVDVEVELPLAEIYEELDVPTGLNLISPPQWNDD